MNIDFGKLTEEQTLRIFRAAMAELSLDDIISALKSDLDKNDREELVAQLRDE